MWTKEMFGTEKPVIALLHLDSLPGDPGFCGDLTAVVDHAAQDLHALQNGGVDGVLIANEYSLPLSPQADPVCLMAMSCVVGALKSQIRVPFGVNVVFNPQDTIKMAAAVGASFGRSAFSGAYTGEYGVHTVDWGQNVRLKYALGRPDLQLLCKLNPEGDAALVERPVDAVIKNICEGGYAGALCVSGPGAGQEASWELLRHVTEAASAYGVPVFCNTGCRKETIEKILTLSNGACVGTALKGPDGRVSEQEVREFMDLAKKARGNA